MTPEISQALATFIGALTTVVLMWAASMWGPNSRRRLRHEEERHCEHDHDHDAEDHRE